MQQLKIYCYGYLNIEKDAEVITQFDTDKARALLVYLAVECHKTVTRSYLAGLLWSDLAEKQALQSLRQTLTILRKVLGDNVSENPIIQSDRDHLRLNSTIQVWVDVLAFKQQLKQAYSHFQRQEQFHQINFRTLKKSLQLRKGEFLDGFSISGAPLFEEWVSILREDLDHQAAEGLEHLAHYYQNRGEFALAQETIQRILQISPWNESVHLMMMRLYAMDNQWSAFENQYRILRKFLKEEIGVEPALDTRLYYEDIHHHQKNSPFLKQDITFPNNITQHELRFIGREKELDEITSLLVDPACRLVTLHGPGGIGKTSLATEIARQQSGVFPDGVYFISLAGISSMAEFATALVEAIQVPLMNSDAIGFRLQAFLRNKTMLVILDNFEQLMNDGETIQMLTTIVRNSPKVKFLLTSRDRLNLIEEWVYPIKGLSFPEKLDQDDPESVRKFDALALFLERARRINPDFEFDSQSISAVIRICQMFEGLPLGIELAAGDVWSQSCQIIAEKIHENWNAINAGVSNVSKRYHSLKANLDASWVLLDQKQQIIFSRLGIFEGDFSIQAAQEIGSASADDLTRLANLALLRHDAHGRYELHAVIRQYTRDKLNELGLMAEAQRNHVEFYTEFLLSRTEKIRSNLQKNILDEIQMELRNLKHAWKWMIEKQQCERMDVFLDPFYQFFLTRSRYQEGLDLLEPAIPLLKELLSRDENEKKEIILGKILVRTGSLAHRNRLNKRSSDLLEEAAQIFKKYAEENELAFCRAAQAEVYLRANEFNLAEAITQKNLLFYQETPDIGGQVHALNTIGIINLRRGKIAEAKKHLTASAALGRKILDARKLIVPLNYLGDIACNEGEYQEAEQLFEESLKIASNLEDLYQMAIVINNLASVYHVSMQFHKANDMYARSLTICRQIGDQLGEAIALSNMGEVALALENDSLAISLFEKALKISRDIEEDWSISICLNNLAQTACKVGRHEQALQQVTEAIQIAWKNEDWRYLARFAVTAGRCYQNIGNLVLAKALFNAAITHSAIEHDIQEQAFVFRQEMGEEGQPEINDEHLRGVISRFLTNQ